MNKDRIQGSVEQAKGIVKEVAGKVTGDAKLETEGKTQRVAGKIADNLRPSGCQPVPAPRRRGLGAHMFPVTTGLLSCSCDRRAQ
jgi:uncharacterized protein YjbJ (UPF0337 family)